MSCNYNLLAVNEFYSDFCTGANACIIEYDSFSGFSLYVMLDNPSTYEKEQFSTSAAFTIKYSIIGNVCFFSIKFGSLCWSDAPFSPCIYKKPIVFDDELPQNVGLALNIFLFDSHNGKLLYIRNIGLGHSFSQNWIDWCSKAHNKMTLQEYHQKVDEVFASYTSDSLADMAENSYSL